MISLSLAPSDGRLLDELLQDALHTVRAHFEMEVAFISQFQCGRRYFRYVDADAAFSPVSVGGSDALDDSYCQRIVDGRLPELIPDGRANAEALTLPATSLLPVGAHLSVPIRIENGALFGTLCCFGRAPDYRLDERDLVTMRLFASFVGRVMKRSLDSNQAWQEAYVRTRKALDEDCYSMVYQPIVHIEENRLAGFEALTRFSLEPGCSPDKWFADAATVGLQEELEIAVIRKALADLHKLPQDAYLSLNVSPETVLKGNVLSLLEDYPLKRILLEITEHSSIDDYASFAAALAPLRQRGLRIAVDDTGAGFASFRHILKLGPDVIKLDTSLVRAIDKDRNMRALAAALIRFAEETGSKIVAEGVETASELKVLQQLKVNKIQGDLLGRPARVEEWQSFGGTRQSLNG